MIVPGRLGMGAKSWTCDDVVGHVSRLTEEFGDHSCIYAQKIKDEHIDGKILLELSKSDLCKELGSSLGHCKKFLSRIKNFRAQAHLYSTKNTRELQQQRGRGVWVRMESTVNLIDS